MPTIYLSMREDVTEKTRKASGAFGSFVTNLNQGLELVTRVGAGAYRALDDMFETAGKSEQLRSGFVNLSGSVEQADANLAAVQGALRGTVSEMEAMEIANTALSFGLVENSGQLGEMTEIGAVLAQSLGQSAKKGVADLTLALSRQSPMILDNLGISLKLSDAYDMYAESLGKTASQLTETEKSQAFLNSALEIGRQKVEELGGFVESSATDWDRFKAGIEDSKVNLAEFVTSSDDFTGWLAEAGSGLREFSEILPGVAAVLGEAGSAVSDFGSTVSTTFAEMRAGSETVDFWAEQLGKLGSPVTDAVEGYREMAAGAEAISRAHRREAVMIDEINEALGTNFTSFEAATAAARNNREEIQRHRDATNSGGKALHDYNEELEEQERAQKGATAALERERAAMEALGLTTDDTIDGQRELAEKGRLAYEMLAESGKFSAETLDQAWQSHLKKTAGGFEDLAIEVIGDNTQMLADYVEIWGPDMWAGEQAAFSTWIDRETNELRARQDELMGPIKEGVEGGLESGFENADTESFGERVGESVRMSLIDVMHDQELVGAFAQAFGIFTGQGIGDAGDASIGSSVDDLGSRERQKVEDILERGAFDAIVSQGLKGAMRAIESGDLLALKRIREGALSNASIARRGNMVHSRDFIESNRLLADLVRDLANAFSLDVPGFARGGIGDFGVETLARLHGREAIIPLNRGGGEVRDAIMGGDVVQALHGMREETAYQTEVMAMLLSDVATNTEASAKAVGGSELSRYQRERGARAMAVARDPGLMSSTTARRG